MDKVDTRACATVKSGVTSYLPTNPPVDNLSTGSNEKEMNKMITATDKTTGVRYYVGDPIVDFEGETYTITGFTPPVGASTGRVYVVSNPDSEGVGHGFYPSVFGLTLGEEYETINEPAINEYAVHLNVAFLNIKAETEDEAISTAYRIMELVKKNITEPHVQIDVDFHASTQTN